MKIHSVSVVGVMVAAAGWLWLVFGVGVDADFRGEAVYNLQKGALAEQLCMLGYVLIVWGAIISGFRWLQPVDTHAVAAPPTLAKSLVERSASPHRPAPAKTVPVVDAVLDAVDLTEIEPTPPKVPST